MKKILITDDIKYASSKYSYVVPLNDYKELSADTIESAFMNALMAIDNIYNDQEFEGIGDVYLLIASTTPLASSACMNIAYVIDSLYEGDFRIKEIKCGGIDLYRLFNTASLAITSHELGIAAKDTIESMAS